MQPWLIPMIYVIGAVLGGIALPRIETAWATHVTYYVFELSVSSAQAYLSAAASGMMALTGIVFAMAFVMVQFSAIAYSPRLVLWFARDRMLFHALGVFTATFIFALLLWPGSTETERNCPAVLVGARRNYDRRQHAHVCAADAAPRRPSDRQRSSSGRRPGARRHRRHVRPLDQASPAPRAWEGAARHTRLGQATQTVKHFGKPRTIARLDIGSLVALARQAGGTIVMACAVGDTLVEGAVLLRVHDAATPLPEGALLGAVRLGRERTFEQDPKYPIRLLVDIAIKALSPAINDPTTAVQTIDQLEDLLRRLGAAELDAGYAADETGVLRLVFPTPTWEDYLTLAFDEIRQFGSSSVQVLRRLRSALVGLAEVVVERRTGAGGAAISRASRPWHRGLAVRRRGPAHGAPGGPAGDRPVAPQRRHDVNRSDCGPPETLSARHGLGKAAC